jgi:hypothetical protein
MIQPYSGHVSGDKKPREYGDLIGIPAPRPSINAVECALHLKLASQADHFVAVERLVPTYLVAIPKCFFFDLTNESVENT